MVATTRAARLHSRHRIVVEDVPLPPPAANELQIAIQAVALCGSDLHYYNHLEVAGFAVKEPLALGHESAGIVVEVGHPDSGFRIGDRVALEVGVPCDEPTTCVHCADGRYNLCAGMSFRSSARSSPHYQGTLQERLNHPAKWCHELPLSISFELGALLEPLSVAVHAVKRAQLPPSANVLILGAGPIGMLCAAVCKSKGATQVTIADISKARVNRALSQGFVDNAKHFGHANRTEDQSTQSQSTINASQAKEQENGYTSQYGYDVVLECTGVEISAQTAILAARSGGRVVLVGLGRPDQSLPVSSIIFREIDVTGTFRYANDYADAIAMFSSSDLPLRTMATDLITHRFHEIKQVQEAFKTAAKQEDDDKKLVLKVVINLESA